MNINRIYCISLTTSIERREKFIKNNPEIVNMKIFQWFLVDKESERKLGLSPIKSCSKSHNLCVVDAKKNGYEKIIIFEDDAVPEYNWTFINKKLNSIVYPKDWIYIMLGYDPIKFQNYDNELYKVDCAFDAHAYIVNVPKVKLNTELVQVDYLFCNKLSPYESLKYPFGNKNDCPTYAIKPILYTQELMNSDISNFHINGKTAFFNFYGNLDNMAYVSTFVNTFSFAFAIVVILLGLFCASLFRTRFLFRT
jgi:hypothetical protein